MHEELQFDKDPKDFRRAADFYEKACRAESGDGCEGLASLLMRGLGRPKDETRAVAIYVQMCEAGRGRACTAAGIALMTGRGVATDLDAGLSRLRSGCANGDVEACIIANDPAVRADVDAAADRARRAIASCALGETKSCVFGQKPLSDLRRRKPDIEQH